VADGGVRGLARSRLFTPRVPPGYIERRTLLDRLERGRAEPLTLVVAPAGYGKSTLIAAWVTSAGAPHAWINLEEDIADVAGFVGYVVTALEPLAPDGFVATRRLLAAPAPPPIDVIARELGDDLEAIGGPIILVLDDLHRLRNPPVFDLLAQLLEHPPPSLHLVLSSRRDPPLPLARLRARGHMTELRQVDLRLTRAESRQLLEAELGVAIPEPTLDALDRSAEGWVTGLRLAALSVRHRTSDLETVVANLSADVRYVQDYLIEETMAGLPAAIRARLVRTAFLDRFSARLVDAICPPDDATDGASFVGFVREQNLFVVALDDTGEWFRHHHLFRSLLGHQARHHLSSAELSELHRRAFAWLSAADLVDEALPHAVAGGAAREAVELVTRAGLAILADERFTTRGSTDLDAPTLARLERWLALLPRTALESDAGATTLEAWIAVLRTRPAQLEATLDRLEALLAVDAQPDPTLRGNLQTLMSYRHNMHGDGVRALACARAALAMLPEDRQHARSMALQLEAAAAAMNGDTGAAVQKLERAITTERHALRRPTLLSTLCILAWNSADLALLTRSATRLLQEAKGQPDVQATAHHHRGEAHYQANELEAAVECLRPVVDDPYLSQVWTFAHGACALASSLHALGAHDDAGAVLAAASAHRGAGNETVATELAEAMTAELALREGRLGAALDWVARFDPEVLRHLSRFCVPQLTMIRALLAEGSAPSLERAAAELQRLGAHASRIHSRRLSIEITALTAVLEMRQGDEATAAATIECALDLARPGGFLRVFVDQGATVAELMNRLPPRPDRDDQVGRILAAFRSGQLKTEAVPTRQQPSSLIEPLTHRELDVLRLIDERLTNREIAGRLGVAAETVKKHALNIYGKLHVGNRRQAATKARALGYLPNHQR